MFCRLIDGWQHAERRVQLLQALDRIFEGGQTGLILERLGRADHGNQTLHVLVKCRVPASRVCGVGARSMRRSRPARHRSRQPRHSSARDMSPAFVDERLHPERRRRDERRALQMACFSSPLAVRVGSHQPATNCPRKCRHEKGVGQGDEVAGLVQSGETVPVFGLSRVGASSVWTCWPPSRPRKSGEGGRR